MSLLPESFPVFATELNQTILPPLLRIITVIAAAFLLRFILQNTLRLLFARLSSRSRLATYRVRLTTIEYIMNSLVSVSIATLTLLVIASDLGFNITPLLTGAGIAGLAISFGAQSLIKDIISGIFLFIDNQINIGDTVKVDTTKGKVIDMQIRTLTLKDSEGNIVYIPNSEIKRITIIKKNPQILRVTR